MTATVRSEAAREQVAALGASVIAPEGFAEHGPFDVILELVGGPNIADDLHALATGGRIAVIGVSAGAKAELNLLALMGKRARIHGSTLRATAAGGESAGRQGVSSARCCRLFGAGALTRPGRRDLRPRATPPRPTTASPPAASSARSSWTALAAAGRQ